MNRLAVVEKFVSINGEGTRAGELAVFLRFRGCNLNCGFVIPSGRMRQMLPQQRSLRRNWWNMCGRPVCRM